MAHDNPSRQAPRRVTLAQVAVVARVSKTTASLALRNDPAVAPRTAARVQGVARDLGYRVDALARALRTGASRSVCAIVMDPGTQLIGLNEGVDLAHTYWFRTFFHLWGRLGQRGFATVNVALADQAILATLPVSVMVLASTAVPRPKVVDIGYEVPIVVPGPPCDDDDPRIRSYVFHEDGEMARAACEHLASNGARHIALACRSDGLPYQESVRRAYGEWADEVGQKAVVIDASGPPNLVADRVARAARAGCDAIYSSGPDIHPIIAGSSQAGRTVGRDFLIVSYSEGSVEAKLSPPISVISPLAAENAERIADTVAQAARGTAPRTTVCDWKLIVRESSGPLSR